MWVSKSTVHTTWVSPGFSALIGGAHSHTIFDTGVNNKTVKLQSSRITMLEAPCPPAMVSQHAQGTYLSQAPEDELGNVVEGPAGGTTPSQCSHSESDSESAAAVAAAVEVAATVAVDTDADAAVAVAVAVAAAAAAAVAAAAAATAANAD